MIAVDTNVFLRLLIDDNAEMTSAAAALLAREGIYLARTVLLETHWVLTSRMHFTEARATSMIAQAMGHRAIQVEGRDMTLAAIAAAVKGLDFEDALHVCGTPDSMAFATFDKKLKKRAARMAFPISIIHP
jgi:predicted nucleic-acid-binding protein